MERRELIEKEYWESRWERVRLPAEIKREGSSLINREILKVFDHYLPKSEGLSVLEIGGAPGQFLAFFSKDFRYSAYALDYSDTGCTKLKENFELLNLDVTIYKRDLLKGDLSDLPRFDMVYSLGFIEHFDDLDAVIARHLDLLKEDGILMIGVPNYAGIYGAVLKRLAPHMLSLHNLEAMDIRNWETFEKKYGLRTIYRRYTGGFEPRYFRRCEHRTLTNQAIRSFFKLIRISLTDRIGVLRRYNSKYWGAYLLGIYRKG